MSKIIECSPPNKNDLAVYNTAGGMHGYEMSLQPNIEYWRRRQDEARDEINPALYDLSFALQDQLNISKEALRGGPDAPISKEYARRLALGTLSVGLLLRRDWKSEAALTDAISFGAAHTMIDMGNDLDDNGLPVDLRIHTRRIDDDPSPERWYKAGNNLYIREVKPIEITSSMQQMLERQNVIIDPDSLLTLYPYLKSRV